MLSHVESTPAQRKAFGEALARQLEGHNRVEFAADVAKRAGQTVSENAVSLWLKGTSEPTRIKVLAIEEVLGVRPGTLSRHLGYVPADADLTAGDTLGAIDSDERLDAAGRRALRALYSEFAKD